VYSQQTCTAFLGSGVIESRPGNRVLTADVCCFLGSGGIESRPGNRVLTADVRCFLGSGGIESRPGKSCTHSRHALLFGFWGIESRPGNRVLTADMRCFLGSGVSSRDLEIVYSQQTCAAFWVLGVLSHDLANRVLTADYVIWFWGVESRPGKSCTHSRLCYLVLGASSRDLANRVLTADMRCLLSSGGIESQPGKSCTHSTFLGSGVLVSVPL
jgi:hypothetical protein